MKINRLETHDRLLHFQKQQQSISDGLMDCIKNVPDSITCPFYVYGHSRSVGIDEKTGILLSGHSMAPDVRLLWVPTITKPKAAPNTYLFLARKNSDVIKIIWMLPKAELWSQYAPGQMCFNENIWVSIQNYKDNRIELDRPDPDGPTEKDVQDFRRAYGHEAQKRKKMKERAKATSKLALSGDSSIVLE